MTILDRHSGHARGTPLLLFDYELRITSYEHAVRLVLLDARRRPSSSSSTHGVRPLGCSLGCSDAQLGKTLTSRAGGLIERELPTTADPL